MRRLPLVMLVREITQEQWGNLRFHALALLTLQEVAEAYVINLFEDANLCTVHAKHTTTIQYDTKVYFLHKQNEIFV